MKPVGSPAKPLPQPDWREAVTPSENSYAYAFLDEGAKREIRRRMLKAVAIPGHQVPFGSREMPIARGWGTGGLQLTLSLIGPEDVLKVIDQGADDSVNAVNIKKFVTRVAGVQTTTDTTEATLIQTRHRIPEEPLQPQQILVFQVPIPEPLRLVEPSEQKTRRMHAEADYSRMWLYLYEEIVKFGEITVGARYPVMVNRRHLMDPSPIPRWDLPRLNHNPALLLFCAGREKRIYAIPPHTEVQPLSFEDFAFRVECFAGRRCSRCGSEGTYLDELIDDATGLRTYACSDTSYCEKGAALRSEDPGEAQR
ncbi:MAG: carbon-phosphorus lyase complex subunit PhnJ [Desulfobacteraceae bacterium]|jgi:alpha-D-ribose 1-methylphosphonate 5-phosphate C-P lyase|nr:MAG: carbon-phosphorus lyase complex subunit PhnJ [Desulfobacteraceae bacterium]